MGCGKMCAVFLFDGNNLGNAANYALDQYRTPIVAFGESNGTNGSHVALSQHLLSYLW